MGNGDGVHYHLTISHSWLSGENHTISNIFIHLMFRNKILEILLV